MHTFFISQLQIYKFLQYVVTLASGNFRVDAKNNSMGYPFFTLHTLFRNKTPADLAKQKRLINFVR